MPDRGRFRIFRQERKESSPDDRLVHSAQCRVEEQDYGVKKQPKRLAQVQQAEQQSQGADQHTDMKTADRQDMRNTEIREGFMILSGDHGLHTEQQRGSIAAGISTLSETCHQRFGKPVAKGGDEPGIGEKTRFADDQVIIPVEAEGNSFAEQRLPEVIPVGIDRTGGMIQGSLKGNIFAGKKVSRFFFTLALINVEGPVSTAGNRTAIQGDGGKGYTNLPEIAVGHFSRDNTGDSVISLVRQ